MLARSWVEIELCGVRKGAGAEAWGLKRLERTVDEKKMEMGWQLKGAGAPGLWF